jgi:hypothetical protein
MSTRPDNLNDQQAFALLVVALHGTTPQKQAYQSAVDESQQKRDDGANYILQPTK